MSELSEAPTLDAALRAMAAVPTTASDPAVSHFQSFLGASVCDPRLPAHLQQRALEERALAHLATSRRVRAMRQRKWFASMYLDRHVSEPASMLFPAVGGGREEPLPSPSLPGRRPPFDRSRMALDWKQGNVR
jgi:hypothetical protein